MRYLGVVAALMAATPAAAQGVVDRPIAALAGQSSEKLVTAYLARIRQLNPKLRAVIALNPEARRQARALDAERRAGRVRGPLHGVPMLIKDNIDTAENATTAGSLALVANVTGRDAPLVARLRAAGAVILGKANLSEWANIRSSRSISGWSATGGQVRNPYALDRTPCGSSGGSGVAVAASLAAAAIGTETNGSVVCPASINGVVGLKPTVGLVSRTHVVPISHSQDTAGPMARSVRDAALLFSAMIGPDAADPATADAAAHVLDYAAGLSADALRGKRVAVLRPAMSPALTATYDAALATLTAAGATLVEVKVPRPDLGDAPLTILLTELKVDLNAYLASAAPGVKARTLADVIAFDDANAAREMPYFGQELFLRAEATKGLADPDYVAALAKVRRLTREAIEGVLSEAKADFYVTPTTGAAWLIDPVNTDSGGGGPSASGLPAIAGWPHLTVPMAQVSGLPVGLSFIGRAYSEATLLDAGFAFEAARGTLPGPTYRATVPLP